MLQIFAKKAFRFKDPNHQQPDVVTRPLAFINVPDWVQHTPLFKWALADGDVSVTESKAQETVLENEAGDQELAALRATAKELGIKGFASMKRDTLEAKITDAQAVADAAKAAEEEAARIAAEEAAKNGGA